VTSTIAAALVLLLSAEPVADPARAELDRVAVRIEQLKAQRLTGDDVALELERLLIRAAELAHSIERSRRGEPIPAVTKAGPAPEELRERADALRDERDRIAFQLKELDAHVAEVRRERRVEAGLESLAQESALFGDPGASRVSPRAPGSPPPTDPAAPGVLLSPRASSTGAGDAERGTALQRLDRLRAERARLAARQAALDAAASALDQEARALSELR